MELIYAELSSKGPVRPKNEDSVGFWQPDDAEEQRTRGAAVILADGVGGQGQGEVASRAGRRDAALEKFREAKPGASPRQAPLADVHRRQPGRLRSRHGAPRRRTHGHHADHRRPAQRRVHHRSRRRLPRLPRPGRTIDAPDGRSYATPPCRSSWACISPHDAANSQMRCMLTRSVGREPMVQVDYYSAAVNRRRPPRAMLRRPLPMRERRGDCARRHARPARGSLPPAGRTGREARHRRQPLRASGARSSASNNSATIADCPSITNPGRP